MVLKIVALFFGLLMRDKSKMTSSVITESSLAVLLALQCN